VGKIFDVIDEPLRAWMGRQALFFVGTAPASAEGHINVSPKGPIGSLRVVDETTIAYLDTVGSGAETLGHLRENGRIVLMLCAFEGPPRILRIHGRGEVIEPHTRRFDELVAQCNFEDPGLPETRRSIVVVHVTRVADSCGYGVPLMKFEGARTQMAEWGERKIRAGGVAAIADYQRQENATTIDGLPAVDIAPEDPPGSDPAP
jgi:hypothetical protein